jgi:biotin carboxyl carrier protein
MKKLRITINNRIYDVQVEVLEDDEQHVPGALQSAPAPPPPARNGNVGAPAPAQASPTPKGADPDRVLAPIAGTVQRVFAQPGTHVEAKAPMVLLDAMKMDMYIYAPRAGTVSEVRVKPGDSVQVGECLLRYAPEE